MDLGDVGDIVNGLEDFRKAAEAFSPEWVSATCDIPAETIRRLAREVAASPCAVVYGRIGLCNQEFGTLACGLPMCSTSSQATSIAPAV